MGDQHCLARIVLQTEVSINPTPPPPPDGREQTGTLAQRESRTLQLAQETFLDLAFLCLYLKIAIALQYPVGGGISDSLQKF